MQILQCFKCNGEGCLFCHNEGVALINLEWNIKELNDCVFKAKGKYDNIDKIINYVEWSGFNIIDINTFKRIYFGSE
jgi:hypothetical protein